MKELDKLNQLGESHGELRGFFKQLAFPFTWKA
jgi:hypothetical protein